MSPCSNIACDRPCAALAFADRSAIARSVKARPVVRFPGFGMRPAEIAEEPPVLAIMARVRVRRSRAWRRRGRGGRRRRRGRTRRAASTAPARRADIRSRCASAPLTASFGLLSITAAMISTCWRSRERRAGGQLPGLRGQRARLGSLHVELMQAGARDMRQRKARDLPRSPGRKRPRRRARPTACSPRRRGNAPRRGRRWSSAADRICPGSFSLP